MPNSSIPPYGEMRSGSILRARQSEGLSIAPSPLSVANASRRAGPSILSFSEGHHRYFEVVPAVTEEYRRENYRLRHQVYCRDLGWEPVRDDGMESDDFDAHSLHCLIRSVSANLYLGCARIVLAHPDDRRRALPFENACAGTLDRSQINPAQYDRSKIAEVSRVAVLGHYRRRKEDQETPFTLRDKFADGERLRLPYLPLGLYLGLIAIARKNGIETLFVLTEPRLAASITRLGVNVKPIGGAIEHRGVRIPHVMCVEDIIDGMNPYLRRFYDSISDEISAAIASSNVVGGPGSAPARQFA